MTREQEEFVLEVYDSIVVTNILDNEKLRKAANYIRGYGENDLIPPLQARNLIYSWKNHFYVEKTKVKIDTLEVEEDKLPDKPVMENRPWRWHLMSNFIDDEGYVWNRGKITDKIIPTTEITVKIETNTNEPTEDDLDNNQDDIEEIT